MKRGKRYSMFEECDLENECSPDLEENEGKSMLQRGFIKDEQEWDEPGPFEQRDAFGNVRKVHGSMPERERY